MNLTMRRILKRLLYGFLGLVVIAAIYNFPLQVRTYRNKRALEAAFGQYSRFLIGRNYDAAYDYGSLEFKEAIGLQNFKAQQLSFESSYGALQSDHEGAFYIHGFGTPMQWIATVEEVRHYERKEVRIVCEFHMEAGLWRIYGYKQVS